MAKPLSITIVGPGNLGMALARALHRAGVNVAEIVHRGDESGTRAKQLTAEIGAKARLFKVWKRVPSPVRTGESSDVIWLCVSDWAIAATASEMASFRSWKGSKVFHSSGALSSDELDPLRQQGAHVASVHPMMTFVRTSPPPLLGIPFAIEGDTKAVTTARKLVKAIGGESFAITKADKPLYHALGAFVSPLIIAQLSAAERIGSELGLKPPQTRKIVAPILQQTIRNYIEHGPAAAFSGPIVRGDAETVRKNLLALKRVRGGAEIYRALAKLAVEELPSRDARAIAKALRSK